MARNVALIINHFFPCGRPLRINKHSTPVNFLPSITRFLFHRNAVRPRISLRMHGTVLSYQRMLKILHKPEALRMDTLRINKHSTPINFFPIDSVP